MNVWNIAGRIGQDAQQREVNGKPVVSFGVAVTTFKAGQKDTMWVDCSWWGESAAKVRGFLNKGVPVAVSGSCSMRTWEKDGQPQAKLQLQVNTCTLLGDKASSATAAPAEAPGGYDWTAAKKPAAAPRAAPPTAEELDDEIPF
ncbi:Ssb Single-stranded DNA-binding protein [uncultured Caudovirales phage]|uniref:Ssb Single-stranded DNA-binding protein n=1 Tax=uncultured Caudovirales phage TaxID=2100421 RepID=A0A6J5NBB5_9CAUD|nr:Ssb Single-stranded DNA-binding protein [uncultured Caudovirales phage]